MIIGCPACHTRYLVDEQALGGRAGRTVRCATCGHTWHQSAPPDLLGIDPLARREPSLEVPARPEILADDSLEVPPRPGASAEPPPPPRSTGRRALRWLVLLVLCALAILAGAVIARGAETTISGDRHLAPLASSPD